MCTISRVRAANERGQRLEKPGNSLGGHTMATAPFGRARSVASCQCLGHITRWAYSDSRRYRKKIRTILEAARWRLRLLVGRVSSFVPVPRTHYALGVFGQSPLPEKDPHDLEAARWRLRPLVARVNSFVPVPRTHFLLGLIEQSPPPEKDPHEFAATRC